MTADGGRGSGDPESASGTDDRWPVYALRAVQLAIVGLTGYGVVSGNLGLVVNGLLGLGVTFVPRALEWRFDHEVDPRIGAWIGLAIMGHAIGFLGLYEVHSGPLAYYDQVAHAVSASFVAGVGYATLQALDRRSNRVRFPDDFRAAFTVLFILAVGVLWEIIEFAVGGLTMALLGEEVLIQYGLGDTVLDLTANTLAATAIALWGTGYFSDVAAILSRGRFGAERS